MRRKTSGSSSRGSRQSESDKAQNQKTNTVSQGDKMKGGGGGKKRLTKKKKNGMSGRSRSEELTSGRCNNSVDEICKSRRCEVWQSFQQLCKDETPIKVPKLELDQRTESDDVESNPETKEKAPNAEKGNSSETQEIQSFEYRCDLEKSLESDDNNSSHVGGMESSSAESVGSMESSISLTATDIRQELRSADHKSMRTVMIIDQIRKAIAEYQKKETMTEDENNQLKRKQKELTKNLHQLEKITTRVKNLVVGSEMVQRKEYGEMQKPSRCYDAKAIRDKRAGGDSRRSLEYEETTNQMELLSIDAPVESILDKEIEQRVACVNSEEEEQEKMDREEPELSPRTKLKNDLQKLADELTEDMQESEEEDTINSGASRTGEKECEGWSMLDEGEPMDDKYTENMNFVEEKENEAENTDGEVVENTRLIENSIFREIQKDSNVDVMVLTKLPPSTISSAITLDCLPGLKGHTIAASTESDTRSVPEVMLSLTGRLSESYSMQEKLAAENADLEGMRYQLQEELITKENTVELLQRKVENLQSEMRLMVRENTQLNDLLAGAGTREQGAHEQTSERSKIDSEEHENTEETLELTKSIQALEEIVEDVKMELSVVKQCRDDADTLRKRLQGSTIIDNTRSNTLPAAVNWHAESSADLREEHQRLQQDYDKKLLEMASLRAQSLQMREQSEQAKAEKAVCAERCATLEGKLRTLEDEKTKWQLTKDALMEQERNVTVVKMELRDAKEEIDEVRSHIEEITEQMNDYRAKYLSAQQQVEEQVKQMERMATDSQITKDELSVEMQRVKQTFQDKLSELAPFPELLKDTQLKLQEANQIRMITERSLEDAQKELQEVKDLTNSLMRRIETANQLGLDEKSQLTARLDSWEKKCSDARDENTKLKTMMARMEEMSSHNEKRLEERTQEANQLSGQLAVLKEETTRQVNRCKEKADANKKNLQGQVAELERQLIVARAAAATAHKDKDDVKQKLQDQILAMNDNFEEAQLRIKSLQSHVNLLKFSAPYTGACTSDPSTVSLMRSSTFLSESGRCDCPLLEI